MNEIVKSKFDDELYVSDLFLNKDEIENLI